MWALDWCGCGCNWFQRKLIKVDLGLGEPQSTIMVDASEHGDRESPMHYLRLDLNAIPQIHGVPATNDGFAPIGRSFKREVIAKHRSLEGIAGLLDIASRMNGIAQADRRILDRATTHENQLAAECRDLAVRIRWTFPLSVDFTAIRRHYDFVVRVVDHPDGAVWDLGKCRRNQGSNRQQTPNELFHVTLQTAETSSLISDGDGDPLISGCAVFVSWDDEHWYQLLWIAVPERTKRDRLAPPPSRE